MENKENNKVEKAVISNKLGKYGITKKTLYSVISVLSCVLLIVALSISQAVFDETKLTQTSYWANLAIICAICIFGMIAGQQMGDDMARNNPGGQFRKTLKKYSISREKVDALKIFAYFDDWIVEYKKRLLRRKIESYLNDNGVYQMEVLDLDIGEIDNLKQTYKKIWPNEKKYSKYYKESEKINCTYFKSCTEEQITVIKNALSGKIKVSNLTKNFFMDALSQYEKDMWESSANYGKKKSMFLSTNYVYKLAALFAASIIFNAIVPDTQSGVGRAAVWLSLAYKLFNLCTAVIWGIYVGMGSVKIDLDYLEYKNSILCQYNEEYEQKIFVPKTIEEKVKEEYELSQKEEKVKEDDKEAILDQI